MTGSRVHPAAPSSAVDRPVRSFGVAVPAKEPSAVCLETCWRHRGIARQKAVNEDWRSIGGSSRAALEDKRILAIQPLAVDEELAEGGVPLMGRRRRKDDLP